MSTKPNSTSFYDLSSAPCLLDLFLKRCTKIRQELFGGKRHADIGVLYHGYLNPSSEEKFHLVSVFFFKISMLGTWEHRRKNTTRGSTISKLVFLLLCVIRVSQYRPALTKHKTCLS